MDVSRFTRLVTSAGRRGGNYGEKLEHVSPVEPKKYANSEAAGRRVTQCARMARIRGTGFNF